MLQNCIIQNRESDLQANCQRVFCVLDGAKASNDHGDHEEEGDEDDEEGDDDERNKEVALGFTGLPQCAWIGERMCRIVNKNLPHALAVGKVARGGVILGYMMAYLELMVNL